MRSLNIDSEPVNNGYTHTRRNSTIFNFKHWIKRCRRYINLFALSRIIAVFERA